MRRMSTEVGNAGRAMGRGLRGPMIAGLNSAKKSLGSLGSSMKHVLSLATSLGGAYVGISAVKQAVELQGIYRNLAFSINKISDGATTWQKVQTTIESTARATGQKATDLARAYKTVFEATGSSKMAASAIRAVGSASTATGENIDELANAAQIMARNFGISADGMEDAVDRIVEKTGIGGKALGDMSRRFGIVANEAHAAGVNGSQGISVLLGLMQKFDATSKGVKGMGEELAPAMKTFFQYTKDGTTQMKQLEKAGHFKFKANTSSFDKVRQILSQGQKAQTQALATYTGPARTFYDNLVRPFGEAVKKARAQGATMKEAQAAGLKAYDDSLKAAGAHSAEFGAKMKKAAADRMKNDPMVKLREAEETMAEAFTDPEMMSAIGSLAKDLPKVADGFAKLIKWVVSNPMLAGGGFLAAKTGGSFAAGFGGRASVSFAKSSVKGVGVMIAEDAAKSGAWKTAGKAIGVVAAAAVAYEIGKSQIDKELGKFEGNLKELAQARADVQTLIKFGGAPEAKLKAMQHLSDVEKKVNAEKTSTTTQVLGSTAAWVTGDPTMAPDYRKNKMVAGADADMKALMSTMTSDGKKVGNAHEQAAKSAAHLKTATDQAAAALRKLGHNGPGRGPVGAGPTVPGATPKHG